MGQGHSQAADAPLSEPGPATTEPEIDPEERARVQAEERERRAVAAQSRLVANQKKKGTGTAASPATAPKKQTPLEQLSAENRGWRVADENAGLRAWN